MPAILKKHGLVVKIWGPPREHGPAHVHVEKPPDGLIIIRLATDVKPQRVWEYYNVKAKDILAAFRLVEENEAMIRAAWEKIHGESKNE